MVVPVRPHDICAPTHLRRELLGRRQRHDRFKAIRAIISDIDGVLTDGRVGYGAADFIKFFNYRDGHWLKLAKRHGYIAGLISGRASQANRTRACTAPSASRSR